MKYDSEERQRLGVMSSQERGKETVGSVTKLEGSNESGIRTCNQGFGGAAHVRQQQQHRPKQHEKDYANMRAWSRSRRCLTLACSNVSPRGST